MRLEADGRISPRVTALGSVAYLALAGELIRREEEAQLAASGENTDGTANEDGM